MAIVGTRNPEHIEQAVTAAQLDLDGEVMRRVDQIMLDAVPVSGPTPESV